jgi:hypothetical protein
MNRRHFLGLSFFAVTAGAMAAVPAGIVARDDIEPERTTQASVIRRLGNVYRIAYGKEYHVLYTCLIGDSEYYFMVPTTYTEYFGIRADVQFTDMFAYDQQALNAFKRRADKLGVPAPTTIING